MCSSEDLSVCVVNVNVIEDAVFPLPQKMVNGTVVLPPGNVLKKLYEVTGLFRFRHFICNVSFYGI